MPRLIDNVVQNLKHFISITHCNGEDRGHVGKFNKRLTWLEQSQLRTEPLLCCLDNLEVANGARLYDSLCDAIDHVCACGDKSRPWFVFAVTHSNDSTSQRSAWGCRQHVLASASRGNLSVILISIGNSIITDELDGIAAGTCMRHIHIRSAKKLENTLVWSASINSTGGLLSAMDYAVIVDTSAYMGMPVSVAAPAPSQPTRKLPPLYPRTVASDPVAAASSHSSSNQPLSAIREESSSIESQIPAGLLLAARAYENSLHEESSSSPPSLSLGAKLSASSEPSDQGVRIRELSNRLLHPGDKEIFREFAQENYFRNLLTQWDEEEIEYLVMVEPIKSAIVGLLVMIPYDTDKVHIRLMVVDEEHRRHGLGTQMLTHVAASHAGKKVTLNVDFDKPELLGFYVIKGYARLEDVSMEHRVLMLTLNHAGLLAKIPLPD